ncbi:redoxin domain-containing protein [Novosphingobium huizhouense]|uniref:redoxin domain-containing protein n=1 Tax=Novosphingobium huizhouense TaxID=2866625 RepID=UPI001CD9003B|nr:redoxin domain-containing protein [Novosphingobium huizhouense]
MTQPPQGHRADYGQLADDLVAALRARRAGAAAPAVGEALPAFALPDAQGVLRRSSELLAGRPAVVSFMRGRWCPYCQAELAAWNSALAAVPPDAVAFVCIVGQTGGAAAEVGTCFAREVAVLCDVDHGLALEFDLAFHLGAPFIAQYLRDGLDLAAVYGSGAGLLPIPATFAVDSDGIVRAAFVEPDFRLRAQPRAMLKALGVV